MTPTESQFVYILSEEPYHDNSTIIGVFDSLEKAKAYLIETPIKTRWDEPIIKDPSQLTWVNEGFYTKTWADCVSESRYPGYEDGSFLIYKKAIQ